MSDDVLFSDDGEPVSTVVVKSSLVIREGDNSGSSSNDKKND